MPFRVTDSSISSTLASRVGAQRQRLTSLQEQISTGKRINRPSDDPAGAGAVLRLKTSQAEAEQFKSSADAVNDQLTYADTTLDSYQQTLDRIKTLLTQGASDTTTSQQQAVIATEIDSLRQQILSVANASHNGEYVFGGTRQNAPPYDSTTAAPSAIPSATQLVQVEPNAAPIAAGVRAETIFADANGTIFDALSSASAALRGTGNAAADKATLLATLDRLGDFADQANIARTNVGASMNAASAASDRLSNASLSYQAGAQTLEQVDFAQAATDLAAAQNALDASLQASRFGRQSLIDFLS